MAAQRLAFHERMFPAPTSVLVLGLGNTLLADDGVGVHIVRRLAVQPVKLAGLHPVDGGTLGFRLLDILTRARDVLLVDAADIGSIPGSIRLFDEEQVRSHMAKTGRVSAHEAGLIDLLTLARLDGWKPARLALLGIQPLLVDWGVRLSPQVADAIPAACQEVLRTVRDWRWAA
jgi:hydrogenase maturation protease